ncbi:hypothetical protein ABIF66_001817 [Bradyrhizobium japonicum]
MNKYFAMADKRDLESAHADLLKDTIPATPQLPKSLIPFRASAIQILDYEQILLSLRDVERAVEAAKSVRQAKAAQKWIDATKTRDNALQQVANNWGNLRSPTDTYQDNKNAVDRYPGMIKLSNDAIALAKEASQLDAPSYKQLSDALVQAMQDNIKSADTMKAQADKQLQSFLRLQFKSFHQDRFY